MKKKKPIINSAKPIDPVIPKFIYAPVPPPPPPPPYLTPRKILRNFLKKLLSWVENE